MTWLNGLKEERAPHACAVVGDRGPIKFLLDQITFDFLAHFRIKTYFVCSPKIFFKQEESILRSKFRNSTSLDLCEILTHVQQLLQEMAPPSL